ncbi:MAG: hypothetical protein ACLFRV_00825 [Acidimicrobiales bacterium]
MTAAEPSFTVMLVGDDDLFQRAEPQLQASSSLLGIGSVAADEAVATALGRAPDVVVIADPVGTPGPSVAELARRIGAALAASRVLVVDRGGSTGPDELIDAGVGGVVPLDGTDLAAAIESLVFGEALLDQALAAAVLERHRDGRSPVALSPTEDEVVTRLAAGSTVDALAEQYAVSPRLVRLHAGGALARLHPWS